MIKELIKLANDLDEGGHRKEADSLDSIMNKLAEWGLGSLSGTGAGSSGDTGDTGDTGGNRGGTGATTTINSYTYPNSLIAEVRTVDFSNDTAVRAFAQIIKSVISDEDLNAPQNPENMPGFQYTLGLLMTHIRGSASSSEAPEAAIAAGANGRAVELAYQISPMLR